MGKNMKLNAQDLKEIVTLTLEHYNRRAEDFWAGTRDHDVSQNIAAIGGQRNFRAGRNSRRRRGGAPANAETGASCISEKYLPGLPSVIEVPLQHGYLL